MEKPLSSHGYTQGRRPFTSQDTLGYTGMVLTSFLGYDNSDLVGRLQQLMVICHTFLRVSSAKMPPKALDDTWGASSAPQNPQLVGRGRCPSQKPYPRSDPQIEQSVYTHGVANLSKSPKASDLVDMQKSLFLFQLVRSCGFFFISNEFDKCTMYVKLSSTES